MICIPSCCLRKATFNRKRMSTTYRPGMRLWPARWWGQSRQFFRTELEAHLVAVFLNGSTEGLAHDVDTLCDVAAYLHAASLGGDTAAGYYEDFSRSVVNLIHT